MDVLEGLRRVGFGGRGERENYHRQYHHRNPHRHSHKILRTNISQGSAWKKRLEKEIETLVESNVGGEGVDEFESIEKSLPWRILSLTFDRIDFCVKDPETFQKLDSDEIVEKFVVRPVDECRLVQFLTKGHKLGEDEIALMVYRVIARQFAKVRSEEVKK